MNRFCNRKSSNLGFLRQCRVLEAFPAGGRALPQIRNLSLNDDSRTGVNDSILLDRSEAKRRGANSIQHSKYPERQPQRSEPIATTRRERSSATVSATVGRQAGHPQPPTPLQLPPDDNFIFCVDAVDLEYRLGDIETDCRNRLHAWLLQIVGALPAPTFMALTCRWRSRPQHQ